MKISSICRKCDANLTQKELDRVRTQIKELNYSDEQLAHSQGTWRGLCDKCKDEPFVVS